MRLSGWLSIIIKKNYFFVVKQSDFVSLSPHYLLEGSRKIEILYQDENIIAVNKPSGLLMHRSSESKDKVFLLQEVRNQINCHVFPVHRLDRGVSGVVVLGMSSEAAAKIQENLQADDAIKEYLALVRGIAPEHGQIDRPLTDDRGIKQEAITCFKRQEVFEKEKASLLRVRILTGRRHQIRRHLSHIKHQVIGDSQYGKGRINHFFREKYGLTRIFLHAQMLQFKHPFSGEICKIIADLPSDLLAVLNLAKS